MQFGFLELEREMSAHTAGGLQGYPLALPFRFSTRSGATEQVRC